MTFPSGIRIAAEDKPAILEQIGVMLQDNGMEDVLVRATARIPIVNFKDPFTGARERSVEE